MAKVDLLTTISLNYGFIIHKNVDILVHAWLVPVQAGKLAMSLQGRREKEKT